MSQALSFQSVTCHRLSPALTHSSWKCRATDNPEIESQLSPTKLTPLKPSFLPLVFWVPFPFLSFHRTGPFGYSFSCPFPTLPSPLNYPDQQITKSLSANLKTKACRPWLHPNSFFKNWSICLLSSLHSLSPLHMLCPVPHIPLSPQPIPICDFGSLKISLSHASHHYLPSPFQ